MKLVRFILPVVLMTIVSFTKAQTTTKPAFTDEDLKKYAITQDSVKGMQQALTGTITEMVQKNTVMSVQRYNELYKIEKDDAKLAEAKATPEEIAFLKQVSDKRAEETARINTTYQALAKEYVGLKQFNAIKKSLESDEAVKAKYDAISKEVESKSGE